MKVLLATYWGVPAEGNAHTYMRILKQGLEAKGHQVDLLSHDTWMQNLYMNEDMSKSIMKSKIRDPLSREILIYYDVHYKEVENWLVWRDIERYTFELAAAYLTEDILQYEIIHTQDIISTRALSRIIPSNMPLVATIHGLLIDEMKKQGSIYGEDTPRWEYVALEEYYGVMSADQTIVPDWLKQAYQNRFSIPAEQMTSESYALDGTAVDKALKIYDSLNRNL